jgi:hypothetical protein
MCDWFGNIKRARNCYIGWSIGPWQTGLVVSLDASRLARNNRVP